MICWHDEVDWRHWQACPARDGGHIIWGRCRSGRRWFWTALDVGSDPERRLDGWADTEPEAVTAAFNAVVELAGSGPASARRHHGAAQCRLKELNAERRRSRPDAGSGETGPVEYLYGISSGGEEIPRRVVAFQVTKKTAKRIYYIRRRYAVDEAPEIGFVAREDIETKGEAINRGAGGWWAADFHLYAQPPEVGRPAPDPASVREERAEVRRLRAEAAAAHPDRGGSNEAFREAYARYEQARAIVEGCALLGGDVE